MLHSGLHRNYDEPPKNRHFKAARQTSDLCMLTDEPASAGQSQNVALQAKTAARGDMSKQFATFGDLHRASFLTAADFEDQNEKVLADLRSLK